MALVKKNKSSLPEQTAIKLKKRIQLHKMSAGDKLPTEPNLMKELGVSRTVLREAIASLKAEGLVEAKQGVGVFITEKKTDLLSSLSNHPQTLTDTIEALELRTAVEAEAASLAVSRCTVAQEADIYRSFDAFERRIKSGKSAEQEDFEFHLSIAKASGNQHFVDFLSVLGKRTIPRARLREEAGLPKDTKLEKSLNEEHRAILEAIVSRDKEAAIQAMRKHLTNGCDRYRDLIREIERSKS